MRHTFNMTGIRFMFDPKGIGKKFSVEQLLLQLATFFALLKLINIIFDFLLTFIIPGNIIKKATHSHLNPNP